MKRETWTTIRDVLAEDIRTGWLSAGDQLPTELQLANRFGSGWVKAFVETLIPDLGNVDVLQSRSGFVMMPMRDTIASVAFRTGDVLISEAHIRKEVVEGYGMRQGHDLEASMAMALGDLALTSGNRTSDCAAFCKQEANILQQQNDAALPNA